MNEKYADYEPNYEEFKFNPEVFKNISANQDNRKSFGIHCDKITAGFFLKNKLMQNENYYKYLFVKSKFVESLDKNEKAKNQISK
jgi:hypothetical protein